MKEDQNFINGSINDDGYDETSIYEELEKEKEEKQKQEEQEREAYEKERKAGEDKEDELKRVNALEEEPVIEAGNPKLPEKDVSNYLIYIQAHTGQQMVEKTVREKIETASKAAAAYMLLRASNTKSYSVSDIHTNATRVKQTLDLANMHETDLDDMLRSLEGLVKGVNGQLRSLYGYPEDFPAYVDKMKTLVSSLMTSDNRSAEYKNMVNALKEVSELDPNSAMLTQDEIISKNYKAMESLEKYMKGKKRVRKTDVGKEHFDNALDALSIMSEHNAMLGDKAQSIVDRINEVRGSEAPEHENHVSLSNYGAERAVRAKETRIEKAKEKKLEITMDKSKIKQKEMNHPMI